MEAMRENPTMVRRIIVTRNSGGRLVDLKAMCNLNTCRH